ncbi:hypothetical protein V5799_015231 [Amblyomma americanum]|uniref:Uncharacterized protein n=1 Tax=Amblyomma americanum TaxID=6943 RepID=A0AAQ4E0R4_AMBAM
MMAATAEEVLQRRPRQQRPLSRYLYRRHDMKGILNRVAKPDRPLHFFVRSSFLKFVEDILKRIWDTFWMDGLLILTHEINDDRPWAEARLMPPTFWVQLNMPDKSYGVNLATGHQALDKLSREAMNGTVLYLTVSMGARRYKPDETSAYRAEVESSDETFIVSIADYCKNKDYAFGFSEANPIAPFYYSEKDERFIAFDDERSLGIKVWAANRSLSF